MFLLAFVALPSLTAQYGDAQQGAEILKDRQCTSCHAVAGTGGRSAPDLARRSIRDFTPSALAASMWNHGPRMWRAMEEQKREVPALSPNDIIDLYAYFFSVRYFEPPGDAGRGKAVFVSKNCNRCHALVATDAGGIGPPVPQWPSLADPVLWVQHMWNHGKEMASQLDQDGIPWPKFTVREMTDLMVYLRNLPSLPTQQPTLRFGSAAAGEDVFESHQCLNCHTFGVSDPDMVDLAAVSRRERTLSGLAVAMWNHRPIMTASAQAQGLEMKPFQGDEMGQLVAYLFEEHYFDPLGEAQRGEKTFSAKKCDSCHGQADSGAPALRGTGGGFTTPSLASAVWRHGPKMSAEFERRNIEWPTLTDRDIVDIIAFLNRE